MTNSAPTKASATDSHSTRFAFSFRMKIEKMIAKKGESLLRMLASASPILLIAVKWQISPAVPQALLINSPKPLPFLILNFSGLRASSTNDTTAATIFLKKAFCMTGTSPDILTHRDIRAKKNPAAIMNRIP